MNNLRKDHKKFRRIIVTISCLVALNLVLSGCEPLRKKFRRAKKEDKAGENFIPVLTPEDYPEPVYSSSSHYKKHYSMWRVWQKDFLQGLEEGDSDKRQRYNLNQVLVQLQEMNRVITGEKQQRLSAIIAELQGVIDDYASPAPMRNMLIIERKVNDIDREIRNDFTFEQIETSLADE